MHRDPLLLISSIVLIKLQGGVCRFIGKNIAMLLKISYRQDTIASNRDWVNQQQFQDNIWKQSFFFPMGIADSYQVMNYWTFTPYLMFTLVCNSINVHNVLFISEIWYSINVPYSSQNKTCVRKIIKREAF